MSRESPRHPQTMAPPPRRADPSARTANARSPRGGPPPPRAVTTSGRTLDVGTKLAAPGAIPGATDRPSRTASADICLVAVGRGPIGEGLGYEEAGIELDRGYVKVDGQLQTTVPHVWAVGDLAATPLQLAHSSFLEGITVAERIAGLDVAEIDYAGIPRVTFSQPEISSVGLTEAQAKEMLRSIGMYPAETVEEAAELAVKVKSGGA